MYPMNDTTKTKEQQEKERKDLISAALDEFYSVAAETGDKFFFRQLFECLTTPNEREEMAMRWQLSKEIKQGKTQREIAKKLGLSLCKITRGSKELKKSDSALDKVLERFVSP